MDANPGRKKPLAKRYFVASYGQIASLLSSINNKWEISDMTKDILNREIDITIDRLSSITKNPIIEKIDAMISDETISQKYDYYDIINLDIQIIDYILLSIRLDILNSL